MSLESEMLSAASPSKSDKERIESCAEELLKEISNDEEVIKYNITAIVVGSVAKGTYLRNPDIDLFLQFPKDFDKKDMQKIGLRIGKRHLNQYEERYAEHPYVHGTKFGYEIDIVPCYRIASTDDLKCAVDRTPFHTKYIQSKMNEEMKNDVRLLKQFTKGIGVYGAEAKVEGMSGYLIELLVLKYGSFREVLKAAASDWKCGYEVHASGNQKFKNEVLIFYDPVDTNRNVASALSVRSLGMFIHASKEYLKNPSPMFFFPHERDEFTIKEIEDKILQRGTHIIVAEMEKPNLVEDNLYPQIRKTLEGMLTVLQKEGVSPVDYAYCITGDKVLYSLEVDEILLPTLMLHNGPPVWSNNTESFLNRWEDNEFKPFICNGFWQVMVRRSDRNLGEYLQKNLKNAALGKDFRELKGLKIVSGTQAVDEKYASVISIMLDKRMNWEVV